MDSKLTSTCSLVGSSLHFLSVDLGPSHSPSCCHIRSAVHGRPAHRSSNRVFLDDPQPDHPSISHTRVPITVEPIILSFSSFTIFIALTLSEIILCFHVILLFSLRLHLQDDNCHPSLGFCFLSPLLSIQVLKQCLEHDRASKISVARTILLT